MIRRAKLAPHDWIQRGVSLSALVALTALVGCGGGGGGGNGGGGGGGGGTQACGSAASSVISVLCGNVVTDGTASGISGATVSLKNAAGSTLAVASTNASGFYKFNTVPAGTVSFQVDPPATGFHTRTCRFGGSVFLYYINNQANTGTCIPATGAIGAGDRLLGTVGLFADANPPPPAFGCPL